MCEACHKWYHSLNPKTSSETTDEFITLMNSEYIPDGSDNPIVERKKIKTVSAKEFKIKNDRKKRKRYRIK